MPPRDQIHDAVRNALVKDGWTVTDDPYTITYGDTNLFADLGAERPLGAERDGRKIVVEIKSFLGPSPWRDFEAAVGQYHVYRDLLEVTAPERHLYLAVSDVTHAAFFTREEVQLVVRRSMIALLIVDVEKHEVVAWTN